MTNNLRCAIDNVQGLASDLLKINTDNALEDDHYRIDAAVVAKNFYTNFNKEHMEIQSVLQLIVDELYLTDEEYNIVKELNDIINGVIPKSKKIQYMKIISLGRTVLHSNSRLKNRTDRLHEQYNISEDRLILLMGAVNYIEFLKLFVCLLTVLKDR